MKHDPGCTGTKPETLCEGCLEGLRQREKLWKEYVELLGEEVDSMVGFAFSHGWRSSNVEKGKELRKKLGIEKEGDGENTDLATCHHCGAQVEYSDLSRDGRCASCCGHS